MQFNRKVRLCFFHVTEKWATVLKKNIDYVKYIKVSYKYKLGSILYNHCKITFFIHDDVIVTS